MKSLVLSACALAVVPLAAQVPRQTQEGDDTRSEPSDGRQRRYFENPRPDEIHALIRAPRVR